MGLPKAELVRRTAVAAFVVFVVGSALHPVWLAATGPSVRDLVYLGFAGVAVVLALAALLMSAGGRRRQALRWFENALLLDLLVVQFFQLLEAQFIGYLAVLLNVALIGLARALTAALRAPGETIVARVAVP